MINKESLAAWRADSVTREVLEEIEGMISELKDALAIGQTLKDSSGQTALTTARMVGEISGLSQVLNISCEEDVKE